jgi:hypothetical protein
VSPPSAGNGLIAAVDKDLVWRPSLYRERKTRTATAANAATNAFTEARRSNPKNGSGRQPMLEITGGLRRWTI